MIEVVNDPFVDACEDFYSRAGWPLDQSRVRFIVLWGEQWHWWGTEK